MKKNDCIRTVLFLLILAASLLAIQPFFIPYTAQDTSQAYTYYEKEDFSEDILIAGPSGTFVGLSPLRIYEDTGLTAYNMGNSVQFPMITYLNVKEAFDRGMKPGLVIINSKAITLQSSVDVNEPFLRRGLDYKRFSFPKLQAVMDIVRLSDWQDPFSYIFPAIRYHSRWTEMTLNEDYAEVLGQEYDYRHGQWPVYKVMKIKDEREENLKSPKRRVLKDEYVRWFRKIADLCEDNGVPVLLVVMPDIRWTAGNHEVLQELTDSMGDNVGFYDFNWDNRIDEAGLDLNEDFYDNHHVNARGSLKTTDLIMKYITDTYDLKESRSTDFLKKQNEEDLKVFKHDLETREYKVKE